jgi:hypothetical protein
MPLGAVNDLRERLKELSQHEEDAERRVRYNEIKAERDKLAAELAAIYPDFAKKTAELLSRVVENDREVAYVNAHALSE